jgi:hypothetical protein
LAWEPSVHPKQIGVTVKGGAVELGGSHGAPRMELPNATTVGVQVVDPWVTLRRDSLLSPAKAGPMSAHAG